MHWYSEINMFVSSVFWVLLCLSSNVESYEHSVPSDRIIGGEPANITDFPYQLVLEAVILDTPIYLCGASIIRRSWAITAAHCVYVFGAFVRLRAGSSYKTRGGTLHYAEKIIIHPNYYEGTRYPKEEDYDVAIIKVSTPFHYSDVTQKIPMAFKTPSPGSEAVVSGWGEVNVEMESPDQLQQLNVTIMDYEECKRTDPFFNYHLTPRFLCANVPEGGKSAFSGDSGGPLVVDNVLVGIVSFRPASNFLNLPYVYTNVAEIRDWVTESIEQESVHH